MTVVDAPGKPAELTYPGVSGAPVTATLVRPEGRPVGGVLIAHGGSDDGRRFFVDEAVELAAAGLVVLLPATRLPPHGDADATRAGLDRAVGDFRRGLDVLAEHDAGRLSCFGHSAGAALGALLGGVEPRLDALVLAGIGSGTVVRIAREQLPRDHPDPDAYLAFLDRFDPRHHLPHYRGRLLIQHARRDDTVTMAESVRMRAAARPGVQWTDYDWGHGLEHPPARRDRAAFLLATGG